MSFLRKSDLVRPSGEERERIAKLKEALQTADAVVIGAGAGLSTSAGFVYNGERFHAFFAEYGFHDMYSGGFYPYPTPEERWAFWSRNIYVNRYMNPPKPVYEKLFDLVKDKDYFVLTTNVDHCFQKAGFDKKRLFYTQGDYGLWQCSEPCHQKTYDNEETVRAMLLAQGGWGTEDDRGRHTENDGSHGAAAPLPGLRQAHEHESAGGRYLRGGRGLGGGGPALFRLSQFPAG